MRVSTDREIHFEYSLILAEDGILLTINTRNKRDRERDEICALCAEMSLRACQALEREHCRRFADRKPGRDKL